MVRTGVKLLALLMVAFVLTAASGVAQEQPPSREAPPDNVQGSWTIYSKNINTGETVKKFVHINQDGHQLTGNFRGPNQAGRITGHVNGHHIEFSTVTRTVLTFRGEIDGNHMSGLYGIHGRHAEWRAVRVN
ncbi:MAG: hypothetical protein WAL85_21465 [Candidatus Korobacteraceae bacterium]